MRLLYLSAKRKGYSTKTNIDTLFTFKKDTNKLYKKIPPPLFLLKVTPIKKYVMIFI